MAKRPELLIASGPLAGTRFEVGAGGVHVKLELLQESQPYHQIPAIAFNMAGFYDYDGGISHPYDRTFYWSNKNNDNIAYGETQYVYYDSVWKSEPAWGKRKACALPIRCCVE